MLTRIKLKGKVLQKKIQVEEAGKIGLKKDIN